ncbi:hypothetical protein LN736_06210 [Clostridium sp. WLY-B-L2]|uniref:PRC-barrel domain-containing protein n=1 Tax=Clostridium aromativorans TaxID=2836848 RepID=A0ABS8N3X2_9CLOT|nr:hypothetical protein [Clostridium aromativorans]MCC9294450.1 hypothetical protein [Clostridium aromativorans]
METKNNSEYKFLNKFLEDNCIDKDKIVIQEVKIFKCWVDIFVVEKEKGKSAIILTKGHGKLEAPITKINTESIILNDVEISKIQGVI